MSLRIWKGFSKRSFATRKTAPHPVPLPASGEREIIALPSDKKFTINFGANRIIHNK
jgi:hypothetical protein